MNTGDHGTDNWPSVVIHDHLVLKWFLTTCLASKYMNKLVGMTTTGECSGCKTAKWWNWKPVICKISKGNMTDVTSGVNKQHPNWRLYFICIYGLFNSTISISAM